MHIISIDVAVKAVQGDNVNHLDHVEYEQNRAKNGALWKAKQ